VLQDASGMNIASLNGFGDYQTGTLLPGEYLLSQGVSLSQRVSSSQRVSQGRINAEFRLTPIPLPAAAWLLLGGLAALGRVGRPRGAVRESRSAQTRTG